MAHFTDLVAIACARPDGGVTVRRIPKRASVDCYDARAAAALGMVLNDAGNEWSREVTDDLIEADLKKAGIECLSWKRIEEADLPVREFRNAWMLDGGVVKHDMEKARDMRLAELRAERAPVLDALDRDWMKAMGQKDQAAAGAIEAKRQALRDMPVTLDPSLKAADTPDALAAVSLDAVEAVKA